MPGKSKWLKGAEPNDLLVDVAEQALESRLDLVWHFLCLAADKWEESPEHVHQLRVWARRALAAMSTFDALLPTRRALWMHKQLKRVRRAAGAARDLDVLAIKLAERAKGPDGDPFAKLHAVAIAERKMAQEPIRQMLDKLERKDFCHRASALTGRIKVRTKSASDRETTYAAAAPGALKPLVADFLAALEQPSSDYAVLHALRLRGKKLRYAMEIFAAALPSTMREDLYPQLASIQEKLGDINDHATSREHLLEWRKNISEPEAAETLAALIAGEQKAMEASRDAFLASLSTERQQRLAQGFSDLLKVDGQNGAASAEHLPLQADATRT